VATLAQVEGKTQIFTKPSKTPHAGRSEKAGAAGAGTMAKFEGEYYLIQDAKTGDRVENGTILRTLPNGQTKVIYDNGDQFYVGPGTAYKVTWTTAGSAEKALDTKIQMMYGRMRGVIAKEGPRKKLTIRTKSATMGVRGTDFFIADTGPNGETEVSVLRGQVEVKPNADGAKAQEIKTGMSASVVMQPKIETKTEPKAIVEVRDTTKEDLKGIQEASTLPAPQQKPEAKVLNETVAELEKKAVAVTLKDIQTYQPEVYQKIQADPKANLKAQDLNNKTVEVATVSAPSAPPKRRKPRITEMKAASDEDFYDKYFKIEE
jgi:hypothetical protein